MSLSSHLGKDLKRLALEAGFDLAGVAGDGLIAFDARDIGGRACSVTVLGASVQN